MGNKQSKKKNIQISQATTIKSTDPEATHNHDSKTRGTTNAFKYGLLIFGYVRNIVNQRKDANNAWDIISFILNYYPLKPIKLSTKKRRWRELQGSDTYYFSQPILYKTNGLIYIPNDRGCGFGGILTYIPKEDTLSRLLKLPQQSEVQDHGSAINNIKGHIYIFGGAQKAFLIYDIKANKWLNDNDFQVIGDNDTNSKQNAVNFNVLKLGNSPSGIVVGKYLHIVGGDNNDRHFILDISQYPFASNTKFIEVGVIPSRFMGGGLVFIEHKNCLLCITGNGIYLSENLDVLDAEDMDLEDVDIEWKVLRNAVLPKEVHFFGSVMYRNIVFIFGGWDKNITDSDKEKTNHKHRNNIYYMDVDNLNENVWCVNELNSEDIVCPSFNRYYGVVDDRNDMLYLFEHQFGTRLYSINILNMMALCQLSLNRVLKQQNVDIQREYKYYDININTQTKGSLPDYKDNVPSAPEKEDSKMVEGNTVNIEGEGEGKLDSKYVPIQQWLYKALDGDMEYIEQYLQLFIENEIDLSVLPDITNQDLIDIGITKLGHRKKLLRAVAK